MTKMPILLSIILTALIIFSLAPDSFAVAPLTSRVNEAFRSVHSRNPTAAENIYWLGRIVSGDKTSFEALRGALFYHKALGQTIGDGSSSKSLTDNNSSDKQTMIIQTLPLFVKIYGNDPTNAEKAWWRKRISCGEIKSMTALEKSMIFHKTKKARQGSASICGGTKASSNNASSVNSGKVAGVSNHPMGDQVRIGIWHTNGSAIELTSNGNFQVRQGSSKIKATLEAGKVIKVSWSQGQYHVRGDASFDSSEVIRLVPLNQGIMQIKNYSDKSQTIPGKNYNRFRGIIEIRKCNNCGELWAINELRTEYYLRGLAESSDTGPEEYIKALGTAARTYVLYHKIVTGGRSINKGWDITNTPNDQIYRGYEYEIITPRLSSIFNKTKGTVAAINSNLVSTVYFSDSDGRTRSAKEVWNTDRFPHLQHSVKDPYHVSASCRGHCVGMSAQGAFGFAKKDNWSFSKILTYYYKGIKIVKAY